MHRKGDVGTICQLWDIEQGTFATLSQRTRARSQHPEMVAFGDHIGNPPFLGVRKPSPGSDSAEVSELRPSTRYLDHRSRLFLLIDLLVIHLISTPYMQESLDWSITGSQPLHVTTSALYRGTSHFFQVESKSVSV